MVEVVFAGGNIGIVNYNQAVAEDIFEYKIEVVNCKQTVTEGDKLELDLQLAHMK